MFSSIISLPSPKAVMVPMGNSLSATTGAAPKWSSVLTQEDHQRHATPSRHRRFLPRPFMAQRGANVGGVAAIAQTSFSSPLTADVFPEGGANLSLGSGATAGEVDENDLSFPFPAVIGGVGVPICRLCNSADGGDVPCISAATEKDEAEEHVYYLQQYLDRFASGRRALPKVTAAASCADTNVAGEEQKKMEEEGGASEAALFEGIPACHLAVFEAKPATAASGSSLCGFTNFSVPCDGPTAVSRPVSPSGFIPFGLRHQTNSPLSCEDWPSMKSFSGLPPRDGFGSPLDDDMKGGSASPSRPPAVTNSASPPRPRCMTVPDVKVCVSVLRVGDKDYPKSRVIIPKEHRSPRVLPQPRPGHNQYKEGLGNSFTLGVDDATSVSSW